MPLLKIKIAVVRSFADPRGTARASETILTGNLLQKAKKREEVCVVGRIPGVGGTFMGSG